MIYILSTIRFILRVLLLSAVVSVYLSLSQNNNKRTFVVETFYNYEFLVYDHLLYVVITPSYKINGINIKNIQTDISSVEHDVPPKIAKNKWLNL
jgi:hypothetical protein